MMGLTACRSVPLHLLLYPSQPVCQGGESWKNELPRQSVPQGHLLRGADWLAMTRYVGANDPVRPMRPPHPVGRGPRAPPGAMRTSRRDTRVPPYRVQRSHGADRVVRPYTSCHCEPVRAAKQVPLGYRLARQSVPFSTGIRIPTPVTRSLARNDSASRCRDVADAVPYEGISGRSVGRPALRPLSFTGGATVSPAPCILPPDMLQWHQF